MDVFVISKGIKKDVANRVLVIDFPLLLNKNPIIHKATYELPNDTYVTPVEHIHYIESVEVELGTDYKDIKSAINDNLNFLSDTLATDEVEDILREPELVTLALVELNTIPKSLSAKMSDYLTRNIKATLNTKVLESLVLDFEEELRKYKQITSLRSVCGANVKAFLNSDTFKSIEADIAEELVTL